MINATACHHRTIFTKHAETNKSARKEKYDLAEKQKVQTLHQSTPKQLLTSVHRVSAQH